jgi:TRAP-type C4-dicarboxylate transport system permease small subunit
MAWPTSPFIDIGEEMHFFETAVRRLAYALAFVAGISLLLMMLQTVLDVVMNNFFGAPIEGNLIITSVYHMVLVVFLPLALVEMRHEHINADLMVRLLPIRLQKLIYIFGALVSIGFFGVLMWQTLLDAIKSWEINEVVMGSIYVLIWPAKFALPAGFLAIILVLLLHVWQCIMDPGFDPTPSAPESDVPSMPVS